MVAMNAQSATNPHPAAASPLSPQQWRHAAWRAYLHPVSVACLVLMWVNDHVLKSISWPSSWVSGKLSDVCGLLFFPLLLNLLSVLVCSALLRKLSPPCQRALPARILWASCVSTGFIFCAIKLLPSARILYINGLLWAFPWLYSPHRPPHLTLDPTDLIALPMIAYAAHIGLVALRTTTLSPKP